MTEKQDAIQSAKNTKQRKRNMNGKRRSIGNEAKNSNSLGIYQIKGGENYDRN